MTNLQLYSKISALPENLKREVSGFIDQLILRKKAPRHLRERKFGAGKGYFELSPDFDSPLEDFNEYK